MRYAYLGCVTAFTALVAVFAIVITSTASLPRPTTPDELGRFPRWICGTRAATEVDRVDRPGRFTFLVKTPTDVRTTYSSRDAARAIEAWYNSELVARGWVREPDFLTSNRTRSFHRWCNVAIAAEFWLTIDEGGTEGKPAPPDRFNVSLRSEEDEEAWTCRQP